MAETHLDNLILTGNVVLPAVCTVDSATTTVLTINGSTGDIATEGDWTFPGQITTPTLIIDNSGADYSGEASIGGGGSVTISTAAIVDNTTSMVYLTYYDIAGTPVIPLWYDTIVNGASFDVHGDIGKKFKWIIINKT